MDEKTLAAYDREAAAFARDWHAQPPPTDLHALVRRFFQPGLTADIGCGSGRDTAWLDRHGFPAAGYDASDGLLTEARRLYPEIRFEHASLPGLDMIEDARFTNVLCETVIMHLDRAMITPSVQRLMSILAPRGTLYLSWRTTDQDRRDEHGRLYAAFDPVLVFGGLGPADILLDEQLDSRSSGKPIRRVVARKTAKGA